MKIFQKKASFFHNYTKGREITISKMMLKATYNQEFFFAQKIYVKNSIPIDYFKTPSRLSNFRTSPGSALNNSETTVIETSSAIPAAR